MATKSQAKRKFDAALATSLVLVSSLGFGLGFAARLYQPVRPALQAAAPALPPRARPVAHSATSKTNTTSPRVVAPLNQRPSQTSRANPSAPATAQRPRVIRRVVRVVRHSPRPVLATTRGS